MDVKTNSLRAWWLAIRPKTLTGAIAPVLVGGAMAFAVTCSPVISKNISMFGSLNLHDAFLHTKLLGSIIPFVLCLLFAVLMQMDANLINDYLDFKKGTDREDRLGPERACAQGWITPRAMQWGIAAMTCLSCLVGVLILLWNMQFELLVVGALCVLFCFLYTTKLSYLGWGDLLVLVFFGIVPVVFTYYVMTGGYWNIPLVIAGVAMGLATDNLLIVNNYRDRHQDKVSGKRTLIVRVIARQQAKLGEREGLKEGEQISLDIYLWLGVFSTLLSFVALFLFPLTSIRYPLLLIYLILHFRAFHQLKTLDGKALNKVLGLTARNIFLFGLLLAVSMFL